MTALAPEHATMPVFSRLDPHASRAEVIAHIAEAARQIRIQDAKLVHDAGAGHIGGDFSAIDILATLYGAVLDVTPDTVDNPERDPFILSKGHVAGALSTTLAAFGFLPVKELATFLKPLSRLNGHPTGPRSPGSRPTRDRSGTGCRSRSATPSRRSSTSRAAERTCWWATASSRRAATGRP